MVRALSLGIVADTTINITWSQPMYPNGPIDGYFVDVTKQSESSRVKTFQRTRDETFLMFKADSEYTT